MSEYTVKINREEGAIEVSGDKDWVDQKLREFASVYEQGPTTSNGGNGNAGESRTRARQRRTSTANENGAPKTTRRRSAGPSRIKGLDLTPTGKQSFEAFVAEKEPKTQHDKNVLAVYYLTEVADVSPVTSNHVFTCYRDQQWPVPTDVANSLARTASRKGFLDTSDLDDIKVEPRGTNHVERGLPLKKAR